MLWPPWPYFLSPVMQCGLKKAVTDKFWVKELNKRGWWGVVSLLGTKERSSLGNAWGICY